MTKILSSKKVNVYSYDDNWDVYFLKEFMDGFPQYGITPTFINKKEYLRHKVYPFLRRCLIIEEENETFYIINHCDGHLSFTLFDALNDVKCLKVLQCQYRVGDNHEKIKPFTYLEKDSFKFRKSVSEYIGRKRIGDRLFFRGNITSKDKRRIRLKIIPMLNDILIPGWNETIDQLTYVKEMAESKIILAVPGNSNFCHREIEGFGLGVPVLMPKLLNSYYNQLIPDYHYVSVDINWELDKPQAIAEAIRLRFLAVKNDDDFLNFVALNGLNWYKHNVLTPSPARIFLEITGGAARSVS